MTSKTCSIDIYSVSLRFKSYGDYQSEKPGSLIHRVLRARFSRPVEHWIYRNLTIRFSNGERIGIVGRNGAGKSTLLKLIAGVYPPTLGFVRVVGRTSPLIGLGAGMQPQLSGIENIILMGTMMGISKQEMIAHLKPIIAFAALEKYAETPVKYYSSGMRQRLSFATATEIAPDILLSDEVFAGGDGDFQIKAKQRIFDCIDQSNIFIFVSHNLSLLQSITERTLWIECGKLVDDGPTAEICKKYTAHLQENKNRPIARQLN